MNKNNREKLAYVFMMALMLRLAYLVYGYLTNPNAFFIFGDSFSYTTSILNLLHNGSYTFDPTNPDAAFGRLPGYPIFWGLHYLIFKQHTYLAVAITQSILDSLVCVFLYHIVYSFTKQFPIALLAALLQAVNIFTIAWVPITGTESLSVCCSCLLIYLLSQQKYESTSWVIFLGVICAVALYIREYLGIFLPIISIYFLLLLFKKKIKGFTILIFVLSFSSLYILWPIRNYLSFHRLELLKPRSAGYNAYGKDFAAFREWMYTWNTDVQPYLNNMLEEKVPGFPHSVFDNFNEEQFAIDLSKKAIACGTSFQEWKKDLPGTKFSRLTTNCNQEIIRGFDSLKTIFIKQHPLTYYLQVPTQNLGKALFKHNLTKSSGSVSPLISIGFLYRSLLVVLGFIGLIFLPRNIAGFTITAFTVFMYLYIPVYIRQVEMRYLLQADVLLYIPACIFIERIVRHWKWFRH